MRRIAAWLLYLLGRRMKMSNGLIVKIDDLSDVPAHQVVIQYQGHRYRISGEFNGLKIHAIDNCLVLKPIVSNQVFVEQVPFFADPKEAT